MELLHEQIWVFFRSRNAEEAMILLPREEMKVKQRDYIKAELSHHQLQNLLTLPCLMYFTPELMCSGREDVFSTHSNTSQAPRKVASP